MSDASPFFRRHRTGLLAGLAGALLLSGGWWWGMERMRGEVKTYLDRMVIPGAAKTGFVFAYDAVEREGLASVVVRAPRFVGRGMEGMVRLSATELRLRPSGWRRLSLRIPEGLRMADERATVALYGEKPLQLTLGWDAFDQPPHFAAFTLPKRLTLRLGKTDGTSTGEFQMSQQSGEFLLRHSRRGSVKGSLTLKGMALQEMVSSASIARLRSLALHYRVMPNPNGDYGWNQAFDLKGLELDVARGGRKPKEKEFGQSFDLGWELQGRLAILPPRPSGALPATADAPTPMLPATYLIPEGIVKSAHLGLDGLGLLRGEGHWTSSEADMRPAGTLRVTVSAFGPLRSFIETIGLKDKQALRVLDAAETILAGWGRRNAQGEIEVAVTREPMGEIYFGPVTVNEALAQMTNGVFRAMGAEFAGPEREEDAPPSRTSQEGMSAYGEPDARTPNPPPAPLTPEGLPMSPTPQPLPSRR